MATKKHEETTTFEFLSAHPDLTSGEIARAMGRSVCSISGQMRQMLAAGRVVQTGIRNGIPTWRINDMPFGCHNRMTMMFNQLLREHRHGMHEVSL
ncbi:hypothetical protein GM31_18820 [Trabulsiella odontotermitis]|uniref:MarR family transcriptional regulator n=2 Tax=Trabulsiella odontotermitis TaxID=379893 RepID=A0A0L0GWV7_9ENTR|nr:hypothetical protein [Trabulsiella odontotermitis]KNC93635.1 hypothetical protein GM31_18820 [Trabulsiella odontotermitis]